MSDWNWTVRELPEGKGRDFCVGDIHGTFDLLRQALQAVKFDPAVDRVFSVGDLIDRGPYSEDSLEFLSYPWFHAVRGNHEQMLLDLYADGVTPEPAGLAFNVRNNGLGWWLDVPFEKQMALLHAFSQLPFALEFGTPRGTVGILHAEVPQGMDWPTFKAKLRSGDQNTLQSAIWGRTRAKQNDQRGVLGVGRLFVGHTPQLEGPRRLGNIQILDTAAVYGREGRHEDGRLSLADVMVGTRMLATPRKLPLIDLHEEVSVVPFGAYATAGSSGLLGRLFPG